jgi:hypothetical protein
MIHPSNARAVLAAGCLLGGMPELCDAAYDACHASITPDSIVSWVEFVHHTTSPPDAPSHSAAGSGASTPISPSPASRAVLPSVFGPYAQRLRADVVSFLIGTLPVLLGVTPGATPANTVEGGRDALLQIFAGLPFEMFKSAVEAPEFQIGVFLSINVLRPALDPDAD